MILLDVPGLIGDLQLILNMDNVFVSAHYNHQNHIKKQINIELILFMNGRSRLRKDSKSVYSEFNIYYQSSVKIFHTQ